MERHTGNSFSAVCYIFQHFETNQNLHCLCFSDLDALPSGNNTDGAFQDRLVKNQTLNLTTARRWTLENCKRIWRVPSNAAWEQMTTESASLAFFFFFLQ